MLAELRHVSKETHEGEFRAAASRLLREQFLFQSDPRDRGTYELVIAHENYFENLFDALGWRFHRDTQQNFVGVTPTDGAAFGPIKVDETLVLLVLRLMFEEAVERHEAGTEGVTVTGRALAMSHAAAGRPAPMSTRMRQILQTFQRRGLLKADLDGPMEDAIINIRSTIRLVTNEAVQQKLQEFCNVGKDLDMEPEPASVSDAATGEEDK